MKRASKVIADKQQLAAIAKILQNYLRLPFSQTNIPGAILEGILGHVRNAEVLRTYDFVDVIDRKQKLGWQVKSTIESTPMTWKRAKIPTSIALITESRKSKDGLQALGDAIINFCNHHAAESFRIYDLDEIAFSRLIVHKDGRGTYYEKSLCTRKMPNIFEPEDFTWTWSKQKVTKTKEQLSALHGVHIPSGKKWFAWHGLGENQLHFSGEKYWWPSEDKRIKSITFKLPTEAERLSLEKFIDLLASADNPLQLKV